MHLDLVTLMAAGSFVAALSGVLLTGAWTQMRGAPALLWWSAAKYVFAVGIGMLAYGSATGNVPMLIVGGGLNSIAPALLWAGTRTFVRRRVSPLVLVAGIVVWFAAGALPLEGGPQLATTIVTFLAWIGYLLASSWEFWRIRAEPSIARRPLVVLLCLHATIFLGGIHDVIFDNMLADPAPPLNSWFGMIHFEGMVYAIGTAILMIVLCKEQLESGRLRAAQLDGLTGIAGRAALFVGADRLLDRCRAAGTPLSVIVFDLDRFKSINDTHGHPTGDRVIRLFVDTARGVLRPNDFFGRHGGEEFAVVLPGATVETAFVLADRVRHAFAEAAREVDGLPLYATVSAGVTEASPSADFSAALAVADRALYHAKNRGRNRVERADDDRPDEPSLIRVA